MLLAGNLFNEISNPYFRNKLRAIWMANILVNGTNKDGKISDETKKALATYFNEVPIEDRTDVFGFFAEEALNWGWNDVLEFAN